MSPSELEDYLNGPEIKKDFGESYPYIQMLLRLLPDETFGILASRWESRRIFPSLGDYMESFGEEVMDACEEAYQDLEGKLEEIQTKGRKLAETFAEGIPSSEKLVEFYENIASQLAVIEDIFASTKIPMPIIKSLH